MYGPTFRWELQLNLFLCANFCMNELEGISTAMHFHMLKFVVFQPEREKYLAFFYKQT